LPLPAQTVSPRTLEDAYRRELAGLDASNAVARLWAKDFTLWPASANGAKSQSFALNWLDLPSKMGDYMGRVQKAAAILDSDRFDAVIFLAMGASNLAAHAISALPAHRRIERFLVLDSTDPATILRVEQEIDLRRALFVVANKSGKVIELHALLLYFLDRLRALGVRSPGQQFIGVTDENSYLAEMGKG
jgi:glucose-6-phosphate isomerase